MNVLSLFDGISVAKYALDVVGIPVAKYYSSEIDKSAISISKKNYPSIISLGNILNLNKDMIKEPIDLLIGGSPCQDLSIAKKNRKGLEGDRSGLFWQYVRLKNELQPKWFILENVASMPQKDKDIISQAMGCEPVLFDASLVSAQCRKRLFWTNISFELPYDRGIVVKDILKTDEKICRIVGRRLNSEGKRDDYNKNIKIEQRIEVRDDNKSGTLTTVQKDNMVVNPQYSIRKLTPIECERLQSLPDNYTEGIATTNRYKCLGNAFNADVIAHILFSIKN
tara:strand:+ start:1253 stop:2095 length:843 start_codon:yes stop_codon:yes gene_type:complete